MGGVSESYEYIDETGIVAMRGEVSYLKGFGDYELGPYAGFGFGNFDSPGLRCLVLIIVNTQKQIIHIN